MLKKLPVLLALALFTVGIFYFARKTWVGEKITLVIPGQEVITVNILDRSQHKVITLVLPGVTRLEVARNLGFWKLESVWQLGKNEKLGGALLKETLIKNCFFPVFYWADNPAIGLIEGKITKLPQAVFGRYQSNFYFFDRLKIALFSFLVGKKDREVIDLTEGGYLSKTKFVDREEGFTVSTTLPEKVAAYFSESSFNDANLKIKIVDQSDSFRSGECVGRLIEVLGGKVAIISREKAVDLDCEIFGASKDLVDKLAGIFECKISKGKSADGFDTVMVIGRGFAKRF